MDKITRHKIEYGGRISGKSKLINSMDEFETQAINMGHSILKIDGQYIESLTVILHTGYLMGQQSRDTEIERLTNALKVCMSALQRETNRMPNYDITESQMWEMFKVAMGEII